MGIWPLAKSTRASEWFFTLLVVTAFAAILEFVTALFLSWEVPTLFDGKLVAA